MVPLGRDDAGHHRHRDRPADPRCARAGRGGSARDRRLARRARPPDIATRRWPGAAISSRRCRSPSATNARCCWPASSVIWSGSQQLRPRVLVGEFGGAAGTLASLGTDGLKVQASADGRAGPRPAGDRLAHDARPHRRGRLLPRPRHRHARQDLDGREADDADRGRGGVRALRRGPRLVSSTMPQKRNPISSNYIHACTAMVRQNVAALLDAMVEDHERSTGPWEIEWIARARDFLSLRRRAGPDAVPGRRACRSIRRGCARTST